MLPKAHRLPSSEIKKVMRHGERVMRDEVRIVFLKNSLGVTRFAFVVPTSIDKRATARNRIKRLLREQIRRALPQLPRGSDVVIIARSRDEKAYSQNNSLLSALSLA